LGVEHAARLFVMLCDRELYQFIPQEPPESIALLEERYRRRSVGRSPDGSQVWLNWAMRLRSTEEYVGTLESTVLSDRTALIAYTVFAAFRGRGYATEASRCVIELLFSVGEVHTVVADIDTRNVASIHVAEALGFQRVGQTANADFFKGTASDEYKYELRSNHPRALERDSCVAPS
jgi:RimJ/RimL family protein N-acetyltransferase